MAGVVGVEPTPTVLETGTLPLRHTPMCLLILSHGSPFYKPKFMKSLDYDLYLKQRKKIGSGSRATIYLWQDYAYKYYGDNYLQFWIDHEYEVQKQIINTNLNVARFYETSFEKTIKMDYIEGETISNLLLKDNSNKIFELFMEEFDKIHEIKNLDLDDLSTFLIQQINKSRVSNSQKELGLEYLNIINNINEDDVLCHMDYHFLNTMYDGNKIYVLDWFDGKNGKKILDFARTYVLIYQYGKEYKEIYLNRILNDYGYSKELFKKAIYINAINRLQNFDNEQMQTLMHLIEEDKW